MRPLCYVVRLQRQYLKVQSQMQQADLSETGLGSFCVFSEAAIRYLDSQHGRQKGRRCKQIHRRMQENREKIVVRIEKGVSEEIEN